MMTTVVGDPALANARYFYKLAKIDLDYCRVQPRAATPAELERVHDPSYVKRALEGWSEEWVGRRPDLGMRAAESAGSAIRASAMLWRGDANRVFVPNAGRTHAGPNSSDRLCVFNDVAIASLWLVRRSWRVAVINLDGLYAPQTEEFLRNEPAIMAISVHECVSGSNHDEPASGIYNFALLEGSGDGELLGCIDATTELLEQFLPDAIICIVGATGHVDDELTGLEYTLDGIYEAVLRISQTADELCGGRLITMGGVASAGSEWASTIWAAATHATSLPYLRSSAKRTPHTSADFRRVL